MGVSPSGRSTEETALAGISSLEDFIEKCGLPTRLSMLESKSPITNELLREVADTTNIIEGGYATLSHDDIYDILTECR